MNESDIEFTVGLDTSNAKSDIMQMADAVFNRMTAMQAKLNQFTGFQNVNSSDFNASNITQGRTQAGSDIYAKAVLNQQLRAATSEMNKAIADAMDDVAKNAAEKVANIKGTLDALKASTAYGKFNQIEMSKDDKDIFAFADKLNKEKSIRKDGSLLEGYKYNATEKIDEKHEEITDQAKAQNREYAQQIIFLTKILALFMAIKKAAEATIKMAFDKQEWSNRIRGFFSVDRESALAANVDKTHAMVYRGIESLGKASPITSSAYDAAMSKMQDTRLKALSGEGIQSDQYVISMQRLFQRYGIGLDAASLLSNGDVNLTDTMNDMLRVLENKILPDLNNLGGVDKELVTKDILEIFGKDIVNGILSHANQRLLGGDQSAAIDTILKTGSVEASNVNTGRAAREVSTAFAEVKSSWTELSNVILVDITPALVGLANVLKSIADKLAEWFHVRPNAEDSSGNPIPVSVTEFSGTGNFFANYQKNWFGGGGNVAGDKADFLKGKVANPKEEANKILKSRSANIYDIFQALFMQDTSYNSDYALQAIEGMKAGANVFELYKIAKGGNLSNNKFNSIYANSLQGKLGELAYKLGLQGTNLSYENFVSALFSGPEAGQIINEEFGEGGRMDIGAGDVKNALGFVLKDLSNEQKLSQLDLLTKTLNPETTGGVIRKAELEWDKNRDDFNRNGVRDFGEVRLKITYNDLNGKSVSQYITTEAR